MSSFKEILTDPELLLKKMTRLSALLFGIVVILMVVKHKQDEAEKHEQEREEHFRKVAEETRMVEERQKQKDLRKILPEQEPLLTPHVLPQFLLPPIFNKIAVPQALVHLRQKRYTAAYEIQPSPYLSFWKIPAVAAVLEDTRPLRMDLPAISPPPSRESTAPRKPRSPPGVGKTYILLP